MESDYTLVTATGGLPSPPSNDAQENIGFQNASFHEGSPPSQAAAGNGSIQHNALQKEYSGEENDVLTPLSEVPTQRNKGILKRTNVVDSSYESSGSRPSLVRTESKVQFARTNPVDPALIELRSFDQSQSGQLLDGDDDDPSPSQRSRKRKSAGSRIRSSITNLAKRTVGRNSRSAAPRPKLQRLQSQLDLDDLSRNELELKASLYFHIGNPIKRWKVEQVVPIKFLLQLLKTMALIVQVILFTLTISHERSDFFFEGRKVFESLFIKNFQDGITLPRDTYTAFTTKDMFIQFDYIADRYYNLPGISLGGFGYAALEENGAPIPITMELMRYRVAEFDTVGNSYTLDGAVDTITFNVSQGDNATDVYLRESRDPLFHSFISLTISIPIKNIRIVDPERAECHLFSVMINFRNEENIGKMQYNLEETHHRVTCDEDIDTENSKLVLIMAFLTVLDGMLIIMSCFSITLTIGSIRRGLKLARAMGTFYRRELGIKLTWKERSSLFPLWHVVNTISDLLILSGAIIKILLEYEVEGFTDANHTSRILGTAVLFQACVIMRYITYFKQLNALTRTIYLAFPELMKFMLCAMIFFLAFTLTGWLVLGPFHEKFESFNASFESLFGILNGDDIYATFIDIEFEDNPLTFLYSRVYLYVFCVLFLYFVLNLFTSLVIVAYDKSQKFDTAYENEVRRFVFSGALTPGGAALRDVTRTKNYVDPEVITRRLKSPQDLEKKDHFRYRGDSLFGTTESDPEF